MKQATIFFLFLAFNFNTIAQKSYLNDAQLWYNIYIEKKLSKKTLLHLNQQTRFSNNISQFQLGYADIGVTYRFTKNFKILVDYVFTQARRNQPYLGTFHQFYVALQTKKDIGRWRFMYRNMFQFQYNNPFTSATGYIPYYYDRNKFTVKYELNKYLTSYIAEELYIPLNNLQARGIDRSRSFIGMFYKLTKHQQLELYFLYQIQLQSGNWYSQQSNYSDNMLSRDFVYGIGYAIDF